MSFIKLDNIVRTLIKKLPLPSLLGSILEAYTLSSIPKDIIKLAIAVYLILIGAQDRMDR